MSRIAGFPIVLTGLAFLAVGLDLGGLLFGVQSIDLENGIMLGPAVVPVRTAVLLESVFLAVGVMTVVFGLLVRFRGRAPSE